MGISRSRQVHWAGTSRLISLCVAPQRCTHTPKPRESSPESQLRGAQLSSGKMPTKSQCLSKTDGGCSEYEMVMPCAWSFYKKNIVLRRKRNNLFLCFSSTKYVTSAKSKSVLENSSIFSKIYFQSICWYAISVWHTTH